MTDPELLALAARVLDRYRYTYDGDEDADVIALEREVRRLLEERDLDRLVEKKVAEAISAREDPQWDGTDFAHPAWWRGEKAGVAGACMRIRQALSGDVAGVCQDPLQAIRMEVAALLAERNRWRRDCDANQDALIRLQANYQAACAGRDLLRRWRTEAEIVLGSDNELLRIIDARARDHPARPRP